MPIDLTFLLISAALVFVFSRLLAMGGGNFILPVLNWLGLVGYWLDAMLHSRSRRTRNDGVVLGSAGVEKFTQKGNGDIGWTWRQSKK